MKENQALEGAANLLATIRGEKPQSSALPYDEDAELVKILGQLEYANPGNFDAEFNENHQRFRARIRYLAALWPEASERDLSLRIHGLINNKRVSIDDLRFILQARSLSDPTKRTNEVPIAIIQSIGKSLKEGVPLRQIARDLKVSYDTVDNIESYLGIRSARRNRITTDAVAAAREGTSIRLFSKKHDISRSNAQRLLAYGRSVLIELGEKVGTIND